MCLRVEITKKKQKKNRPQIKKKKVLFYQDNAPCPKSIATIGKLHELHFILPPQQLYSSDMALMWLLAVCRPQKNARGKDIWLQWRSDIGNWGVFWGQRQIVLQKWYQIVREALELVYHPKKRLCWLIQWNFSKNGCFIS